MELIILLKAFILGIVEGATEFLPISSTGHLIIVGDLLDFNDATGKVFEIVIQLGAILAICWEYRSRLAGVIKTMGQNSVSQRFTINIAIAFLPAALLGLACHGFIKTHLFSPITVAIALIAGGFAILFIERLAPEANTSSVDDITPKQALKIGLAQSLALIPGVSRSGATILGGMVFGLSRKTSTEFSFFLAIPIMFAATGYDLLNNRDLLAWADVPTFIVGFVTAFFAALIAVKVLLRYVSGHDFRAFAWYRIILGVLVLAYFWQAI
jgi:undecaprenyl-diphosphatase